MVEHERYADDSGRGVSTSSSGLSSRRLGRVRDVLARIVDSGFAPGAVAVIARHGRVHVQAMGNLAFEGASAGTAMAADTICRLASMTKPIVAACAMTLVEDCTLRLDDPVDALLPELAGMRVLADPNGPLEDTVPAERAITLRDLLAYTAGTGMTVGAASASAPITQALAALKPVDRLESDPSSDTWIRRLGAIPLVFQPGERWMYDIAADVTGVLIARATGMSLGDALRERICGPLGMNDTAFRVTDVNLGRLATPYVLDDATGAVVVEREPDGRWTRAPAFEAGGAGLVSTATDFLAFASALLAGGRHGSVRVLSRPSVTLMTSDHLTPEQKATSGFWPGYFNDIGWGFGMAVRTRRTHLGPSVGSYGWNGKGTAWYNDPAEDMATILMVQRAGPPWLPIYRDFWTSVYQAIDD